MGSRLGIAGMSHHMGSRLPIIRDCLCQGGTRVSGNYQLYPEHCDVPKETVMDETLRVAKDLLSAIKKLQGQESILPGRHTKALQKLSEIFNKKNILVPLI